MRHWKENWKVNKEEEDYKNQTEETGPDRPGRMGENV